VEAKFNEFILLPEDEHPPIVREVVSTATLDQVNGLIISWHACVSRLMSLNRNPTEPQVADIERHIKLFLCSVEEFDKSRRIAQLEENVRKEKQKARNVKRPRREPAVIQPIWRRKPNYLGLLNYPETIRLMGPLRTLTKLDLKGEAHIKHLKNKMKQGMGGTWAYNTMLRYYQERSLRFVLKDSVSDIGMGGLGEKMKKVAS